MRGLALENYSSEIFKSVIKEYENFLCLVEGKSVYLEEYARGMIGQEEMHVLEITKMLRDFQSNMPSYDCSA